MARFKQTTYGPYRPTARPMTKREKREADLDKLAASKLSDTAYQNFKVLCHQLKNHNYASFETIEKIYRLIGHDEDAWNLFKTLHPQSTIEQWNKANPLLRLDMDAVSHQRLVKLMYICKNVQINFNEHFEELWSMLNGRPGAWENLRTFAPSQVARWEKTKEALDAILPVPELRKIIYKIKSPNETQPFILVDEARRMIGEDKGAWERFEAYMPAHTMREFNGMKHMLLTVEERLKDNELGYSMFVKLIQPCTRASTQDRSVKLMHQLIGGFSDAWKAFVDYMPQETARFREALTRPAPPGFDEDWLHMLLKKLPLPSMGRLASSCVWFRTRIGRCELSEARKRCQLTHGLYDVVANGGILIKSTNEVNSLKDLKIVFCILIQVHRKKFTSNPSTTKSACCE
jgi:hypothetical protein